MLKKAFPHVAGILCVWFSIHLSEYIHQPILFRVLK